MPHTLRDIAQQLRGQVIGDGAVAIRGVNGLDRAQAGDITFIDDAKRLPQALASKASAIVLPAIIPVSHLEGRPGIAVANPKLAFAQLLTLFHPTPAAQPGIHPSAVLGKGVTLGEEVAVRANVTLGDRVQIGRGSVIEPGAFIGDETVIGEQVWIGPNVVIYDHMRIGNRVRLHGGVVIGADGFGYVFDQGRYVKVPQVGNVVIEDDVELGANVCVDRATLGSTVVGQGTKVDNLVQIAHNDQIGRHVIFSGQVGLAGTVKVGDYCVFGGKVGVGDHLTIGERVQAGGGTIILQNVDAGQIIWGWPARPMAEAKEQFAAVGRLPNLLKRVRELVAQIAGLDERLKRLER